MRHRAEASLVDRFGQGVVAVSGLGEDHVDPGRRLGRPSPMSSILAASLRTVCRSRPDHLGRPRYRVVVEARDDHGRAAE
jgi:hypothetical protein